MYSSWFYLGSMRLGGKTTHSSFPCWGALHHKHFPPCSNGILMVTTSALPAGVNTVAFTYRFPGVKKQSISSPSAVFWSAFGVDSQGLLTTQCQVRQNVCLVSWSLQWLCNLLGVVFTSWEQVCLFLHGSSGLHTINDTVCFVVLPLTCTYLFLFVPTQLLRKS